LDVANYPRFDQVDFMKTLKILSPAEQVACRLREDLAAGMWKGQMPGVLKLEADLGVNRKAVEAGLEILEKEGLIEKQGAGRRRKILHLIRKINSTSLRVAILAHDPPMLKEGVMIDLRHQLQQAEHRAFYAAKCLTQMGMSVDQVASLVKRTPADAWVVNAASREILEWFYKRGIPTFALYGRRRELPIAAAGPDKIHGYREVVRHLVPLGHRRIVLLALRARRLPYPGAPERAFLDELEARGIATSAYHLPDWDDTVEGLHALLDSLFRITPPTALFIDQAMLFHAVKHRLARMGLRVPEDVSLVCTDPDHTFVWCRPSISHLSWDSAPWIRRIVSWVNHVSRGSKDVRQLDVPVHFVPGGTIGPAKL
jgi:DNA-binding LacI/PurR family transcriptional regulator